MLRFTSAFRVPTLLLLLTPATVFLFSPDRGHFYRGGSHSYNSAKDLAMAENLSPAHRFRIFVGRHLLVDGLPAYDLYGRFPIGGHLFIKLAIVPFDGLAAKIVAARLLMLLLFSIAAVLAYHATAGLTGSRWIALTATLLAFSSHYLLYYSDMINTEVTVDLCGVLWVFQGMVVFVREGRFQQLVGKTCGALLVGWHVYALLLAFIGLGIGKEVIQSLQVRAGLLCALESTLRNSRRYVVLGVMALGFGTLVLGFNFANEYTALDDVTSFTDLPSVQAMLSRTGLNPDRDEAYIVQHATWPKFLRNQFYGIGVMVLSYASALDNEQLIRNVRPGSNWIGALGILVTGACLAGVCLFRHRLLATTLVLSGFCWAVPMRYNTGVHDFERVFYVGIPLVFFSLILLAVRHFWGRRLLVGLAIGAVGIFGVASFQMSRFAYPAQRTAVHQAVIADFESIRPIVRGKNVLIAFSRKEFVKLSGSLTALDFYLSGSTITGIEGMFDRTPAERRLQHSVERRLEHVDFVLSREQYGGVVSRTPGNRRVFLYAAADVREHLRQEYQRVVAGTPVVRNRFALYLAERDLTYVKAPCEPADVRGRFVLRVVPADGRTRGEGDREFMWHAPLFDEKCMATVPLPASDSIRVHTEQVVQGERVWEAKFAVGRGVYREEYAPSRTEPAHREQMMPGLKGR